ncbi:glycosyl hydrolase [Aspergillus luchuensis]|uniref:Glycosyl hydrolase n=1 Tax=Aspergillus kawachii TaxID=1069201 RepID=A0A146FUC0_ASPKA|nr:glycosyl hydrolase [Aspergillus luchuensis]
MQRNGWAYSEWILTGRKGRESIEIGNSTDGSRSKWSEATCWHGKKVKDGDGSGSGSGSGSETREERTVRRKLRT